MNFFYKILILGLIIIININIIKSDLNNECLANDNDGNCKNNNENNKNDFDNYEEVDSYEEEIEDNDDDYSTDDYDAEHFLDPVAMQVTFINNYPRPLTLFWEDKTGLGVVIDKSVPGEGGKLTLNTYVDHTFYFGIEGTRDRIGDLFIMNKNQKEYIINKDAKRLDEIHTDGCYDRMERRCKYDANNGECERNPGWMIVNCPKACNACDILQPSKRCTRSFLNITEEPIWKPGDLNAMFEDIIKDDRWDTTVVSKDPWIITFDNFVKDDEIKEFLKQGEALGYQRSTDTGPVNERGESQKLVSKSRTSENAWCMQQCKNSPIMKQVTNRIEQVTKIPNNNYEDFQLLRYRPGQYYRAHHDMSPHNAHMGGGPRILTFFLYLNDVEEGGETDFPLLNIKVKPKRGRAVLWPSVMDDNSYKQDPRTRHAALPVIKGIKYASNHWIHSNDFKKANLWGCTGSFD